MTTFFMMRLGPDSRSAAASSYCRDAVLPRGASRCRAPVPVVTTLIPADPSDVSWTRSKLTMRFLVVEPRPQLDVLGLGEIALRLDDEEVGRQADLELAGLGLEPPLRQLACGAGGVDALLVALDEQRGVGDVGGDLQLEGPDLRLRLPHA